MTAPVSVLGGLARKPLSDAGNRLSRRMVDEGVRDRARSVALAKAAYDNSRASQFVEQWADLTAWTLNGAASVQVSGNKMYSTAANPGCAYRPLSAPTGGTVRIVGTVTSTGGSGGVMVGMSVGVPGSGLSNQYGIYLEASSSKFRKCTNGALVDISATNLIFQTRTYVYTITLDAGFLSVVIVDPTNPLLEWRAQFDRTTVTGLTNLCLTNQHSLSLTGAYFGPLGVVQANSTVTPRAGIEGIAQTVTWTRLTNPGPKGGKFGIRVALPASYDPSTVANTGGYPVVMCFHNNGGNETFFADNALNAPITNKLLAAGFIVASVGYDDTTSWGEPGSLNSYAAGYRYLRDNFAIGDLVFYANSMGGIEALLTLAQDQIPGVLAYAATSPTANLAANYANTNDGFNTVINSAYGITATATTFTSAKSVSSITVDLSTNAFSVGQRMTLSPGTANEETVTVKSRSGASSPYTYTLIEPTRYAHASGDTATATYAQATAGYDPVLKQGDSFRGVPMLLIHATDDTSVTKADNSDALAALVAPYSDNVTVVPAIGGHSFAGIPNFADQIANFFKRYLRIM